jgi:hypothetical protein
MSHDVVEAERWVLGWLGAQPGKPLPPRQALALVTPVLNKDKALDL